MPDIPSVRGPFSFLDSIGSAVSDVTTAKNKEEMRRRDEQAKQAGLLNELISSGSVDPSSLQGPQVSGYYAASGGIDPTKLSSAPYRIKQEQATQAKQTTQVGALDLNTSMQHATALANMTPDQVNEFYKIPGSVDVATADDKQLAAVAKRYVYAAHGDANAGYAAAQLQATGETRAKLQKEFFGQAAVEYSNEQKELEAKLIAAARAGGRAGTPQEMLDNFMRVNVAQQNVLQEELAKMGNPVMDQAIPGQARRRRQLSDELTQYMAQQQLLNAKMSTIMGVATPPGMAQPKAPPAGPGASAAPAPANDPVASIIEQVKAKRFTVEQVNATPSLTADQKARVLAAVQPTAPAAAPTDSFSMPASGGGSMFRAPTAAERAATAASDSVSNKKKQDKIAKDAKDRKARSGSAFDRNK